MTHEPDRLPRTNILGVGISAINMAQALERITALIERRARAYVVVCTVYNVMLAQRDRAYHAALCSAEMITPDGMPLAVVSRWFGQRHVDRVYGPDLLLAFSEIAAERGYSFFLYGGTDGVAEALGESLRAKFPTLRIAGTYSPPLLGMHQDEDERVIAMINDSGADIVWVGLGTPKQDFWMARHRPRLTAPLLIGIGAAFDFHAGRIPQAPRWMMRSSLEWLFRLWVEPRRMWRRYLIYNPLFVWGVIMQALKLRRYEECEGAASDEQRATS